ncbi:outer membrane protein assembly factor BamA [Candidatus Viadribacter manganicus]|uniref:outer membrane protein assembly factor BamA n=1 Tax=Candidatus Viadribacter manganicus TaxID=1759059 RepID=UPI0009F4569C|nr:outer membrane protein assembly factor BamA [Candidatus Viadribacter manganicus]
MKRVLRDVALGALGCVATVGAGAGALLAASTDAYAQQNQTAAPPQAQAPGVAIRRVLVEGNQRIEPATISSYLQVGPGDTFDPERIDMSIKTLFATGLFSDVQIEQRGSDLVVVVSENPIINRVVFEGMRTLDEEDLEGEVQARPRSVFTPARAQADVQRILDVYRRNGRFAAQVTPQVRELDQNRVDLIFEVDEGPVTGVRDINFIGNEEFSDRRLRDAIVTTESTWMNFFSNNDNYDPDRLEYDREQLRQFYNNRGYADFRVVSAVAELTPDQRDFFITFTVDEGVQYEFGEITIQTELNRLPEPLLRAVNPIRPGTVFRGDQIEDAIDAMTYVAGTVGYANVQITPVVERDRETRKVNITFEVDEGPRTFIERIDIVGNTRTVDRVIRREMRVSEGDAFNRVLLDRSQAQIRSLGFFTDVKVEDADGSQPDRSVVTVTVEEQSTGEFAFAAGYSSTESFLFDVSVTERNLRGRGQFLRLRASSSSQRQQLDLRFTEPRFMGREIAAGFDLYSLRTDFLDQSSFENQSTGIGLRTGFRIGERTNLGLTYSLIQDDTQIADVYIDHDSNILTPDVNQCDAVNVSRPLLCDQEGTFITSVLGFQVNWDRRNSPVNATRGFNLDFSQDVAGLGGEVNYLRTELEGGIYYGLPYGFRALFRGSAGVIAGWNGDNVRINDRFFKGGSSFRGFDVAGIGPRQLLVDDITGEIVQRGDAVGGNAYAIGTLQLDVPLPLPESFSLGSALFVDFGTLGYLDAANRQTVDLAGANRLIVDDSASLRVAAGVSIFWDSPFGPVQFDFAQPLQYEDYDRREQFRFSTRTSF